MQIRTKLVRYVKYYANYIRNWLKGDISLTGRVRRPVMCKHCPNILGKDVAVFHNGVCQSCAVNARIYVIKDETERILRAEGLGNNYIDAHRAKKARLEQTYKYEIKSNPSLDD